MPNKTKLLLIPCSGAETTKLAKDILDTLKENHGLENTVEILESFRRKDIHPDSPKNHTHELVSDYFNDSEIEVDIGRNPLKDVIRGKHIVFVEHLLTPIRKVSEGIPQAVSVNDHLMTLRGYLNVTKEVETLRKTLIAPYLPYVRSHSIEKYKDRGFYQFDSLRTMLNTLRSDGLDTLITIDPHSDKASQIANELGLEFHQVNPFQSGRSINPYKLGLPLEKTNEFMPLLRPFFERFRKIKESDISHIYLVSPDSGTEFRVENFTERAFSELPPEQAYKLIAYFDKDRISYDNKKISFKPFSQICETNIDKEGTYIIIDDMGSTFSTANTVAEKLKKCGAKRVELWVSHTVTMPISYDKAKNRTYLDKVVSLDTVPQDPNLNIEFIPSSAYMLAAELYKSHLKFVASRNK